jgi:hypothetical protein
MAGAMQPRRRPNSRCKQLIEPVITPVLPVGTVRYVAGQAHSQLPDWPVRSNACLYRPQPHARDVLSAETKLFMSKLRGFDGTKSI